jgi:hypothetical protein
MQEGVSIPKHLKSTADVRVFGKAELNIDFTNFIKQEAVAEEPASDR